MSKQTLDAPQLKKRKTSLSADEKADLAPISNLLVKRHSEKARIPTKGSPLAAGYDLYSAEQKIIPAHGKALIDTQLSIAVPAGTYGRVAPRSGLASKFMIDTGAGVIDADYRGIVFVLLFNLADKDFEVKEGDRIAQLILERIYTPEVLEVQDLDETLRGSGGFGSTGGHGSL
ncbi:dUTPase-like protein [Cytidiella melzeri]|nr:dUTPase-like protein [Cytidiella melzeri]